MNNEEPSQTAEVQPLVTKTIELPLQASTSGPTIPRPISVFSSIYQWQPMGIRVTLKLPFVGDDWGYLFVLRNGPFIPRHGKPVTGQMVRDVGVYAYNNMRNVFLAPKADFRVVNQLTKFPENYPISCTTYDFPPMLSTMSQCFRRWRGDMQYRIRVVAGFGTQGYLIGSILKNEIMPVGIYNEYAETPLVTRNDFSYRELMAHGYVMSDTSMFRHLELTVPYDYPTPFYDQYDWIAHRVQPDFIGTVQDPKPRPEYFSSPHGDNFIIMALRGSIDAQSTTTMQFELEYRAVEGFQFAEPGLPPEDALLSRTSFVKNGSITLVKTIPDSTLTSDGIGKISKGTYIEPGLGMPQGIDDQPLPGFKALKLSPLLATLAPPSDSSSGAITYPYGPPSGPFKSVAMEQRAGRKLTHALRKDGTWISWVGDVRPEIERASSEEELHKNPALHVVSASQIAMLIRRAREQEFT